MSEPLKFKCTLLTSTFLVCFLVLIGYIFRGQIGVFEEQRYVLKAVSQPQDPGGPVAESEDDIESGISNNEKEYGPEVRQRELAPYSSADTLRCDGPECPYRQATLPGGRGYPGSYFPIEPIKNPETLKPVVDDEELVKAMIRDMSKKPCIKLCMELGIKLPALAACSKDCRGLKREKVLALIGRLNRLRETNRCAAAKPATFPPIATHTVTTVLANMNPVNRTFSTQNCPAPSPRVTKFAGISCQLTGARGQARGGGGQGQRDAPLHRGPAVHRHPRGPGAPPPPPPPREALPARACDALHKHARRTRARAPRW